VAIYIPDTLAELPEKITVRGFTWSVIGTDDPDIGHRRSHLHIPDSISWTSDCSFRDSFVEFIQFGLTSSLKVFGGLVNCCVERLTIPSSVEVMEEGAFENCCFLAVLDFSFCRRLREIHGFSGCFGISQIAVPACVHTIGSQAFNDCLGLRVLTFEEDSCIHLLGGFCRSTLTSVIFPRSLVMLASEAFNDSQELSRITFEDGSLIVRIEGLRD
jgi:hypothetical protein